MMRTSALWKLKLSHVESVVFFAAMLLVIALETVCVCWLGPAGAVWVPAGVSPNLVGQWTAATLPQCWLLGALLVLMYRMAAMALPPRNWGGVEAQSNRRAFLRLWRWTVAMGTLEIGALYFDRFTMGVH